MPANKHITNTMLTVPANLVPYLRDGLFGEWGFAAEDIADRALQFGSNASRDIYSEALEAFDAGRTLLDAVGWCDEGIQADIEINLALHPKLVLRALKSESRMIAERVREMPRNENKEARNTETARATVLRMFARSVQEQIRRLGFDRVANSADPREWIDPLQPRQAPLRGRQRRP
jgi:hypothetical protein